MKNTLKQLSIFLVGIVSGAALGVLMAPDKGTNTRKKIVRAASDTKHKLEDEMDILRNKYNTAVSKNLENVKEKVDSAKKVLSVN